MKEVDAYKYQNVKRFCYLYFFAMKNYKIRFLISLYLIFSILLNSVIFAFDGGEPLSSEGSIIEVTSEKQSDDGTNESVDSNMNHENEQQENDENEEENKTQTEEHYDAEEIQIEEHDDVEEEKEPQLKEHEKLDEAKESPAEDIIDEYNMENSNVPSSLDEQDNIEEKNEYENTENTVITEEDNSQDNMDQTISSGDDKNFENTIEPDSTELDEEQDLHQEKLNLDKTMAASLMSPMLLAAPLEPDATEYEAVITECSDASLVDEKYETLLEALNAASGKTATIELLKDAKRTSSSFAVYGGNITLLGNGHTIDLDSGSSGPGFELHSSSTLNLGKENGGDANILIIDGGGANPSSNQSILGSMIQIWQKSTLNMYDGVVMQNRVNPTGTPGLAIQVGNPETLNDACYFNMYGGKITGMVQDFDCAFDSAPIYVAGPSHVNIYDGEICNNRAWRAGGIYALVDSEVTIYGGKFHDNTACRAPYMGNTSNMSGGNGGFANVSAFTPLVIAGGEFYNNHAESGGGVIYANRTRVTLYGGTFHDNSAEGYGGVFYANYDSDVKIDELEDTDVLVAYNNSAGLDGGFGDAYAGSNITINSNVKIHDNIASRDGGAFCINNSTSYDPAKLTINDGIIYENQALEGAGIYIKNNSLLVMPSTSKAKIFNNDGSTSASDIYAIAGGITSLVDADGFDENYIDGKLIDGWYKDTSEARYKDGNITHLSVDEILTANATEPVYLIAAHDDTVKLMYDVNGGDTSTCPATEEAHLAGQPSIDFTVSSAVPTWENHTFKGWALDSSSTVADYAAGETITISADTTLYAIWEEVIAKYNYRLIYDANGGNTMSVPADKTQLNTTAESHTFTVDGTATNSGFTFKGWGLTPAATAAEVITSAEATKEEPTIVVYAIWERVPTYNYRLIYNANGGDTTSVPADKTHFNETEESYTFTVDGTATNSGFTFKGWGLEPTATAADAITSTEATKTEPTVVVYAIWERVPTYNYRLVYDANGGDTTSIPAETSENDTTAESHVFTLDDTTIPTKEGYTFQGWGETTSATATDAVTSVTATKAEPVVIVYAIWDRDDDKYNYRLIYDANGGDTTSVPADKTQSNTTAESYTFTVDGTATNSGFTFKGWGLAPTATAADAITSAEATKANPTVVVYAIWERVSTYNYRLVYDANGGDTTSVPAESSKNDTTAESHVFTLDDTTIPTKEGYTFQGWGLTASATDAVTAATATKAAPVVTVYAIWMKDANKYNYRLIYDANGGDTTSVPTEASENDTIAESHVFTLDDTTIPTKDGYTFQGWGLTASATDAVTAATATKIEPVVTVYAIWEIDANKYIYRLIYDANGGDTTSVRTEASENDTIAESHVFTLDDTTIPTKEGYTFQGWGLTTSSTATDAVTSATATKTEPVVIVYAIWDRDDDKYNYRLIYDANGGDTTSVPVDKCNRIPQQKVIPLQLTEQQLIADLRLKVGD